jgi:flagellar biosynthesis protein FliR
MHGELRLGLPVLVGFLLVLTRIGSALALVPIPGLKNTLEPARAVLSVSIAVLLFPLWPSPAADSLTIGRLLSWMAAEAAFGVTIGVVVAMVTEGMLIAAQALGLQAGYAYVSSVDPTSQADSTVLQILAQLTGSLLFFALGLDRQIIQVFARSLVTHPPGSYSVSAGGVEVVLRLGSDMFAMAVRLALPVIALLLLVDIALALVERVHAQLHLLSIAFPVKMAAALLVLAWTASSIPRVYMATAEKSFTGLTEILAVRR